MLFFGTNYMTEQTDKKVYTYIFSDRSRVGASGARAPYLSRVYDCYYRYTI